jgi:hypothetical protein
VIVEPVDPAGPSPASWPGWASPTRRSRSPSSTTWNGKPPARSAASSPRPVPRELFLQALPRRAELFAAAGITRVVLDDLRHEALDDT